MTGGFQNWRNAFTSASRNRDRYGTQSQRVESNAKKQIGSVSNQLREEKDVRSDADKETERTCENKTNPGEASAFPVRPVEPAGTRYGRPSDPGSQALRDEIKRRNEDTSTRWKKCSPSWARQEPTELLAGLFVEVAKCLNQDVGPKTSPAVPRDAGCRPGDRAGFVARLGARFGASSVPGSVPVGARFGERIARYTRSAASSGLG